MCNFLSSKINVLRRSIFFSSEDVFFQVREQEFDANVWIRSLNALTWVEILRQVLVASGFGPKQHLLNQEFFNKVLRVAQHSKVLNRSMLLLCKSASDPSIFSSKILLVPSSRRKTKWLNMVYVPAH